MAAESTANGTCNELFHPVLTEGPQCELAEGHNSGIHEGDGVRWPHRISMSEEIARRLLRAFSKTSRVIEIGYVTTNGLVAFPMNDIELIFDQIVPRNAD